MEVSPWPQKLTGPRHDVETGTLPLTLALALPQGQPPYWREPDERSQDTKATRNPYREQQQSQTSLARTLSRPEMVMAVPPGPEMKKAHGVTI